MSMARFNATGIAGLQLSFEEFARMPDTVIDDILKAESKVVVKAHKAMLRSLGLYKTGKLEASIEGIDKVTSAKGGQRYVLVYPVGTHHKYAGREKTKGYKRSKSGSTYTYGGGSKTATANDVGFIHEYGAPKRGIKAKQWMRRANDKCEPEVEAAGMAVYDDWLKSLNL